MAINFKDIPLGLHLCDSMVPVGVVVGKNSFPAKSTMRKVELRVYEGDSREPTDRYESISWEPDDDSRANSEYCIDIQHALRAIMGEDTIDPNSLKDKMSLPMKSYFMCLGSSYLLDGKWWDAFDNNQFVSTGEALGLEGGLFCMRGRLSDYERNAIVDSWITEDRDVTLSRKPEGEVSVSGALHMVSTVSQSMLYAEGIGQSAPTLSIKNADDVKGLYLDTVQTQQYVQFLFINSLGVPETVCARMLRRRAMPLEYDSFVREQRVNRVPDSYGAFYGALKAQQHATLDMSSGAVTAEWAEWWATEFLTAKRWWVRMGDRGLFLDDTNMCWRPCVVTSKNEAVIYDQSKAEASHVDFSVKMGWQGSEKLSFLR